MKKNRKKTTIISIASAATLLLLWQIVSIALDQPVILPTIPQVFKSFIAILTKKTFLLNVGATVLRALESFLVIFVVGGLLGVLAGTYQGVRAALSPLVTVFKATPVMSVILIAFIWFRTGAVPVFSAFLMGFPVMFVQTIQGVKAMDPKLDQMCKVYKIEGRERLLHYVIPSMMPYFGTGAKLTLSMVWKVVIAAEVLTVPSRGIGRSLQLAQVQLETSEVMAWTAVAVILTSLGDHLFDMIKLRRKGNQ